MTARPEAPPVQIRAPIWLDVRLICGSRRRIVLACLRSPPGWRGCSSRTWRDRPGCSSGLGQSATTEVLELHRRLLRKAFARHGGYELGTEGDAPGRLRSPGRRVGARVRLDRWFSCNASCDLWSSRRSQGWSGRPKASTSHRSKRGFAPPLVQKGASHRRATSGLNDEANRNGRLLSDFNPKIRP